LDDVAVDIRQALSFDVDGVEVPNIFTSIFFTIAVILLGVITLGILYLSLREALDKREESEVRSPALFAHTVA